MSDKTSPPTARATAEGLPADLRLALVCWYRAWHHGSGADERDAGEMLSVALADRVQAMRDIIYPERERHP